MTTLNDQNNAKYLKYRSKFFISEFLGTALLLLVALSVVILMFGTGSPMAHLVPDIKLRHRLLPGFIRLNRRYYCIISDWKNQRGPYQPGSYNGILVISQD